MNKVKVIQVPTAQGCLEKNLGTEKFPLTFAQILGQKFHVFDKTFSEKVLIGKIDLKENDFEENCKRIKQAALEEFSYNKIPFFVGGDHSITYPIVEAFSEKFENKEIGLIVFDAHVDCSVDFLPASHEDIVRGIVKRGFVKAENVLLLGVRKVFDVEEEFLRSEGKRVRVVRCEEIKKNFHGVKKSVQEIVKKSSSVYVSIDVDVFDPGIAPGTGYLEENGLLTGEFFGLFEEILKGGKVTGVDLVEVNLEKDKERKTQELAEKIFNKVIRLPF